MRIKTTPRVALPVAVLGLFLAAPAVAQSTGPAHAGFDPNAPMSGHIHEGELGEKLMALESALRCNCSCGLDVHSCQFAMQCGTSPGWSMRLRDALERGEEREVIEAGFVADFGPTVLMSPPAEGFNLLVWTLPAIALLTAGMLAGLFVRAGTRGEIAPAIELTAEDEDRLRLEMQKLDEAESPDW